MRGSAAQTAAVVLVDWGDRMGMKEVMNRVGSGGKTRQNIGNS
jgi:hypothetical protein